MNQPRHLMRNSFKTRCMPCRRAAGQVCGRLLCTNHHTDAPAGSRRRRRPADGPSDASAADVGSVGGSSAPAWAEARPVERCAHARPCAVNGICPVPSRQPPQSAHRLKPFWTFDFNIAPVLRCSCQVLGDDAVAALLVEVHDHVLRAAHSLHLRRAMAPLRAVLQLLRDRVTAPATFAYAIRIILQLMAVRYALCIQSSHWSCRKVAPAFKALATCAAGTS